MKSFIGCCFQRTTNSNKHSQQGRWEQGRSPVGGDCYHTIIGHIIKLRFCFEYIIYIGAMAIASYGFNICQFGFDGVVGDYTLRGVKC